MPGVRQPEQLNDECDNRGGGGVSTNSSVPRWVRRSLGGVCIACLLVWRVTSGFDRLADRWAARAETFRALDLQGNSVQVSPGERGRCVLLFFCMCPNCKELARQFCLPSTHPEAGDVQVFGILHADPRQGTEFLTATRFPGILLLDPLGKVHEKYGIGPCPNAWLVNSGGTIRFFRPGSIIPSELSRELTTWLGDRRTQ
jgi:peroxiredoxin